MNETKTNHISLKGAMKKESHVFVCIIMTKIGSLVEADEESFAKAKGNRLLLPKSNGELFYIAHIQ
jgi:hypothetical protein